MHSKDAAICTHFIGQMNALCKYLRQSAVLGDNLHIYQIYVNLGNTYRDKTAIKQKNIILAFII